MSLRGAKRRGNLKVEGMASRNEVRKHVTSAAPTAVPVSPEKRSRATAKAAALFLCVKMGKIRGKIRNPAMRPSAIRGAVFRKDAIAGTRALPIDRRRMRRTGGSEHPGESFRRCGTLSPRWPALRRAPLRRRRRRRRALRCRSRCRRRALRRQRGRCPPRCASIRRRPSRKSRTGRCFCRSGTAHRR